MWCELSFFLLNWSSSWLQVTRKGKEIFQPIDVTKHIFNIWHSWLCLTDTGKCWVFNKQWKKSTKQEYYSPSPLIILVWFSVQAHPWTHAERYIVRLSLWILLLQCTWNWIKIKLKAALKPKEGHIETMWPKGKGNKKSQSLIRAEGYCA